MKIDLSRRILRFIWNPFGIHFTSIDLYSACADLWIIHRSYISIENQMHTFSGERSCPLHLCLRCLFDGMITETRVNSCRRIALIRETHHETRLYCALLRAYSISSLILFKPLCLKYERRHATARARNARYFRAADLAFCSRNCLWSLYLCMKPCITRAARGDVRYASRIKIPRAREPAAALSKFIPIFQFRRSLINRSNTRRDFSHVRLHLFHDNCNNTLQAAFTSIYLIIKRNNQTDQTHPTFRRRFIWNSFYLNSAYSAYIDQR